MFQRLMKRPYALNNRRSFGSDDGLHNQKLPNFDVCVNYTDIFESLEAMANAAMKYVFNDAFYFIISRLKLTLLCNARTHRDKKRAKKYSQPASSTSKK